MTALLRYVAKRAAIRTSIAMLIVVVYLFAPIVARLLLGDLTAPGFSFGP